MATADEEQVAADKPEEVAPESNDAKADEPKSKKAAAPRKRSASTHPPFLEVWEPNYDPFILGFLLFFFIGFDGYGVIIAQLGPIQLWFICFCIDD